MYQPTLIVKLYGEVENDPSSDGMTMALINQEGVQWIRSWGETSQDDTAGIFGQFSEDFWVKQQGCTAAPTTPGVEMTGSLGRISLKNHFPVLDQQSMQHFVTLLQQEVEGGVLAGYPPAYIRTRDTLTEQIDLLENKGDHTAIFKNGATIAIDGDHIFADYQDTLDEKRAEQKAKRQRRNP